MTSIEQQLIQRIDQLLATRVEGGDAQAYGAVNEALQGTLTVLAAVHGRGSQQQATLLQVVDTAHERKTTALFSNFVFYVWPAVRGALQALKAEIQTGLVGSIQRRTVGEVLVDMLALAKDALDDGRDAAKNVAAVLTAAAFEDTIRRMGSAFANVHDRRNLADMLTALKDAKVIEGAQVGIIQSYLKFRNDALHADWDKLTAVAVGGCIGVVEQLVLKHFS